MQYHDVYFGYYVLKLNSMKHKVEQRFGDIEQLIKESTMFVRNDWNRYCSITETNKLVASIRWEGNRVVIRRFN